MCAEQGKSSDAVIVATPDHWHALPTIEAMQLGKHVYTEKPIARTVWEVRQMMAAARKYNVVTHMGKQGHSFASHQTFKSWVQKGLLGEIREVHTWTTMRLLDSKSKIQELANKAKVPEGLNWDLWVGPGEYHDYSPHFTPNRWRAWTPYGTGNPFETAGYVAENAALGAVAVRLPGVTLEWDHDTASFTNNAAANALLKPEYRKGYTLTV